MCYCGDYAGYITVILPFMFYVFIISGIFQSQKYWVEAINCENYIVNHTPTKYLQIITSEEEWNKINPDVSY